MNPANVDRVLSYYPFGAANFMPLVAIATAQGCALFQAVAVPPPPGTGTTPTEPTVVASMVEVDWAQFEAGKGEWRVDGITNVPFEVITVYLGDHTLTGAQVIGQTAADDIGAFSMRVQDSAVSTTGGFVSAVSDTGGFGTASIDIK